MPPRPTAERSPSGLNSYWTHVWDHALNVMKAQGTWSWELKPLLDEYVFALIGAEKAREGFGWLDALEKYAGESEDLDDIAWSVLGKIAGSLPNQWDRHTKRAAALADQLVLTERSRKAAGIAEPDEDKADPFDALDEGDELAQRRARSA